MKLTDGAEAEKHGYLKLIAIAWVALGAAALALWDPSSPQKSAPSFASVEELQEKLERAGMPCRYQTYSSSDRILCNYAQPKSRHYQSVLNDHCSDRSEHHVRYCMEEALGQFVIATADLKFESVEAKDTFLDLTCLEVAGDDAPVEAFNDACVVGPNWFVTLPTRELAYRTRAVLGGGAVRMGGRLDPEQARLED